MIRSPRPTVAPKLLAKVDRADLHGSTSSVPQLHWLPELKAPWWMSSTNCTKRRPLGTSPITLHNICVKHPVTSQASQTTGMGTDGYHKNPKLQVQASLKSSTFIHIMSTQWYL